MLITVNMKNVTLFHANISLAIHKTQIFSTCPLQPNHRDKISQVLGSFRSYRNTDEMCQCNVLAIKTVNQKRQ
jgi:hypothetical protein